MSHSPAALVNARLEAWIGKRSAPVRPAGDPDPLEVDQDSCASHKVALCHGGGWVVGGWWCGGGVVVWWCGGVVVWWCGGVVVWWCGGVGGV